MTNTEMSRLRASRRYGFWDRVEYQVVVKLAFVLCLAFALFKRLTGRSDRTNTRGSAIAEARSAAHAAIGYAYLA